MIIEILIGLFLLVCVVVVLVTVKHFRQKQQDFEDYIRIDMEGKVKKEVEPKEKPVKFKTWYGEEVEVKPRIPVQEPDEHDEWFSNVEPEKEEDTEEEDVFET